MKEEVLNKIKNVILQYIIISACISAGYGIFGSIFMADEVLSFKFFLQPFMYGAVCVIPGALMPINKEPSKKQLIVQNVLNLVIIEAIIAIIQVAWGYKQGKDLALVLVSVLVIYGAVNLIMYVTGIFETKELMREIENFQKNQKEREEIS